MIGTGDLRRAVILGLLPAALTACGGSSNLAPPPAPAQDASELAELEALFNARTDSATMDVDPADVRFMTGMVGHHAQALVMSHMAPTNGASEVVRVLAGRIINAQQDEIRVMQTWLRDRELPVPDVGPGGEVMAHGHEMHMAGMLTSAQLDELRAAQGEEFDRTFLRLMIQHHNGAVSMVHELFATDGAAQDDLVFKLASDIQVDQITEVARMERMLEEMGSGR